MTTTLPFGQNTQVAVIASATLEASHILKTGPGTFYGGEVTIGATAGFLLLFDSATIPADGAVLPLKCWVVPASSTIAVNCPMPVACSSGISVVFSTTGPFSKTASASAFFSFQVF